MSLLKRIGTPAPQPPSPAYAPRASQGPEPPMPAPHHVEPPPPTLPSQWAQMPAPEVAPEPAFRPISEPSPLQPAASGAASAPGTLPEPRTLGRIKMGQQRDPFANVKSKVLSQLAEETNRDRNLQSPDAIRRYIEQLLDSVLLEENLQATRADRARLLDGISADALGFGPIQPLLDDESITEVMVNGPQQIYIERAGKLHRTDVRFEDDDHVMRVIDRIVSPLGRRVDESSPYVDARLPDGSRVNAIIPPISLVGPVVTIRKFSRTPLQVDDLIRNGSLTAEMAEFMRACVLARLNMIVSGGTGSGKTTLLNVLSGFIPDDERIVTIEDSAELQLRQEHVVSLEARPANIEGKGEVTIRDLVANSLRMRPERIVVGEVRRGEALDMLAAMNTGHDGSLTTAHANTPRDMLSRLETMVLMAGVDLPLKAIRDQISKAIDLIVQQARMQDGTRKITYVTEVTGMEGDVITMQDIFVFEQTGFRDGKVVGQLRPTGIRPKFVERFASLGVALPPSIFGNHYATVA